jgi:hypothetical protein
MKNKQWQARRDLNPQPPDLESGALAVRATGLKLFRFEGSEPSPVKFPESIVFLYAGYASDKNGNIS